MARRAVRHLALLTMVCGAVLIAVPALAYVDTSPGSGMSTSTSTVQPGQAFSATATFTDLPQGTSVSFSSGTSTCTNVSFNPTSATLNASHSATTSVTIPSSCAGQSVALVATGPQGQTVSAAVSVAGGFPNTAAAPQSLPFGWIVFAIGLLLLVAGTFGFSRRSQRSSEARA